MNTEPLTFQRLSALADAHDKRWQIRAEKVHAFAPPTIDAENRAHAPYDGYEWEGKAYLGGQYLPDEEGSRSTWRTIKVKCLSVLAESLCQQHSAYFSKGKDWGFKDSSICYLYICAPESMLSSIACCFQPSKKLVLVSEASGLALGKPFKFYFKKALARTNGDYDLLCELYPGVEERFDKQLVAFAYAEEVITA